MPAVLHYMKSLSLESLIPLCLHNDLFNSLVWDLLVISASHTWPTFNLRTRSNQYSFTSITSEFSDTGQTKPGHW